MRMSNSSHLHNAVAIYANYNYWDFFPIYLWSWKGTKYTIIAAIYSPIELALW
jgi:hypothetical protein